MSCNTCETQAIASLCDDIRTLRPLVHCITNYVTVNDCANILLAAGAAPVMADDSAEAAEIASIAQALVINIGTLNERTIESMKLAARAAAKKNIPILLDPVGAGASALRTKTALSLVEEFRFAAIRGNRSEIAVLLGGQGGTRGVDATGQATEADGETAARLAEKTGAVVAVTGAVDYISDGAKILSVSNGHPMMAQITGSGCMLSALLGAWLASGRAAARDAGRAEIPGSDLHAAAGGIAAIGLAGEAAARAAGAAGTGSFRVALIDAVSRLDGRTLGEGMRLDAR
ncbi:MAG: hydroxyethylthiazole kinase [Spirochaetales bacterium]|nr:hydroxyethylthiazole kinase [Spirochaetales bacterium]